VLWDLEGRDATRDINPSYLRGAHGVLYVVDGTRRETFDQLFEIQNLVLTALGDVPSVVALNKSDLTDQWQLTPADEKRLSSAGQFALGPAPRAAWESKTPFSGLRTPRSRRTEHIDDRHYRRRLGGRVRPD
jgi:GTPase SAR1 family protein